MIVFYRLAKERTVIMDIPKRLIFLRERKGYTVYKLGQTSDVSSSYIHKIESGEKKPSVDVVARLCEGLGLTLSDFFSEDNNELTPELQELLNHAKKLTVEQVRAVNSVFKTFK